MIPRCETLFFFRILFLFGSNPLSLTHLLFNRINKRFCSSKVSKTRRPLCFLLAAQKKTQTHTQCHYWPVQQEKESSMRVNKKWKKRKKSNWVLQTTTADEMSFFFSQPSLAQYEGVVFFLCQSIDKCWRIEIRRSIKHRRGEGRASILMLEEESNSTCICIFVSDSSSESNMAENDEPQIYKKRYKVDKKLGAGNFGTAYLVADLRAKNDA